MVTKTKPVPKPRSKLHEVLAAKAKSNAAGKHGKTRTLADLKIRELLILNGDNYVPIFLGRLS